MMTLFIAGEDLLRLLEKIDADRKCDISCAFSELNSNRNIVYRINKITKLRILAQDFLTYEFSIDSENSSIDKYRNKTAEVHFRLKSYKAFRCNSIGEREQLLYGLNEKNGIRYNIETYKQKH